MIRRILCWFGWHEWESYEPPYKHEYDFYKCKHCGKVKR